MRRFVIGLLVGGGLMYVFLHRAEDWSQWAAERFGTLGSQYRGDAVHRKADEALH